MWCFPLDKAGFSHDHLLNCKEHFSSNKKGERCWRLRQQSKPAVKYCFYIISKSIDTLNSQSLKILDWFNCFDQATDEFYFLPVIVTQNIRLLISSHLFFKLTTRTFSWEPPNLGTMNNSTKPVRRWICFPSCSQRYLQKLNRKLCIIKLEIVAETDELELFQVWSIFQIIDKRPGDDNVGVFIFVDSYMSCFEGMMNQWDLWPSLPVNEL